MQKYSKVEVVHHINNTKNDNRIENLMLFSSTSEHSKYHFPKGSYFGIHHKNTEELK